MDDEPDYQIHQSCADGAAATDADAARAAVEAVLRRHEVQKARISLVLVGDLRIAELNARYLGHEGPTDVLTFDLRDPGEPGNVLDGEIVISWETAALEGAARGHGTTREIALYAVHGALHLLGFSDKEETAAAEMHRIEDNVLSSLGMGQVYASPGRK